MMAPEARWDFRIFDFQHFSVSKEKAPVERVVNHRSLDFPQLRKGTFAKKT
jgi:hypothetical protein